MSKTRLTIWLVVATVVVIAGGANAVTDFNDGKTHVIDYTINDSVHIDDGFYYAETQTTVNIVEGGNIPSGSSPHDSLNAYNQSIAGISGGRVDRVFAYDTSTVNMSEGSVTYLRAMNTSNINISGGNITGNNALTALDSSKVEISGGSVKDVRSHHASVVGISGGTIETFYGSNLWSGSKNRVIITGGTIGTFRAGIDVIGSQKFRLSTDLTLSDLREYGVQAVESTVENFLLEQLRIYDTSTVDISGGIVDNYITYDSSIVYISGGHTREITTHDSSIMHISGGSVESLLYTREGSAVNISGGSVGHITSFNSSTVNISGGSVNSVFAYSSSTVTFLGNNFVLGEGLSLVGDELFGTGTLSGQWLDGTAWTTGITHIADTATIFLIIPEPCTLLLLAIGGLLIRKR